MWPGAGAERVTTKPSPRCGPRSTSEPGRPTRQPALVLTNGQPRCGPQYLSEVEAGPDWLS
jgi:hypothetical protein